MPAGFKSTTLIGKNTGTIPGFVSKVPQDNVTIFQHSKDPEQIKHPVSVLTAQSSENIRKIDVSVSLTKITVADNPITKFVPTPSPSPETPVLEIA